MPILHAHRPQPEQQNAENENGPLVNESSHHCLQDLILYYFFLAIAFISDSSTTGAGPEMPPSFLMRQKCTAINIDATSGIPMQCQMYERSNAFESTIDPPSNPKRTSL